MNSDCPALRRLLRAVRRRLWLQSALSTLALGLLPAAGLLTVAGIVHAVIRPLPALPILIAAALPPFAALLAGLWRRPSAATCAGTADRWFGGQTLLASAWDVLDRPPAHPPAGVGVLLRQAERQAQQWLPAVPGHRPIRLPGHAFVSPILLFTGSMFLTTGGAPVNTVNALASANRPATAGMPQPTPPAGTELRQLALAASLNRPTPESDDRQRERGGTDIDADARPLQVAGAGDSTARPAAPPIPALPITAETAAPPGAATATGSGSGADAAGTDAAPDRDGPGPTPAAELRVQFTAIQRQSAGRLVGAGGSAGELDPVTIATAESAEPAPAPAVHPGLPYAGRQGPADRAYVAAYFTRLNQHE